MRTFWATAVGAVIGLAGGIWGVIISTGIGFLLDLVLADLRVQRHSRALVSGEPAAPWLPPILPAIGVVAGAVAPARLLDSDYFSKLETQLAEYRPNRFSARLCERAIASAAEASATVEQSAALLTRLLSPEDRRRATRAVWQSLRAAVVPPEPFRELRRLALLAGIDKGFVERELAVRPHLDTEACEILGVGTDASVDQVRRAYRTLAAQFHPDTTGELSERQRAESSEAFIRVRDAYERLMAQLDE